MDNLIEVKKILIELYKPKDDTEKAVIEAIIATAWQAGYESANKTISRGLDQIEKIIGN